MNANEIRIGIYLMELTSDDIFQVKDTFYQSLNVNLECSRPIAITEKWLKDFGYFIIETNKCVEAFRENFRYSIQQVENSNQWSWCDGETVITNLEFVHEIQNLYFALSKKDLVISTAVS